MKCKALQSLESTALWECQEDFSLWLPFSRHWACCRWVDKGGNAQGGHLQKLPVPVMLAFGACSGLVAQTATYPFDVVRRQMQVCATSSLMRSFCTDRLSSSEQHHLVFVLCIEHVPCA